MVGLNPEFAHETMSGLSFSHAVAQTLWHDKLFHIDLNAQRIGKYDQDFRFGSEGIRDAFYTVMVLEDAGWDGMRHFDAHPYRTEDSDGIWDFARGCMRTYLILREKVRRFHADADIAEALSHGPPADITEPTSPGGIGRRCPGRAALDGRPPPRGGHGHAPATATSVSTSWSPSCCSGCGERRPPHPPMSGAGQGPVRCRHDPTRLSDPELHLPGDRPRPTSSLPSCARPGRPRHPASTPCW